MSADAEEWIGVVMRFSGASTDLVNVSATTAYATDRVPRFPAVTPTTNRTFILRCLGSILIQFIRHKLLQAMSGLTVEDRAGRYHVGVYISIRP